jgi:mono/diheme cytochrome c family protein
MKIRTAPVISSVLVSLLAAFAFVLPAHADDAAAAAAPAGERPAEFTPERIEKGKQMYKQLCLRCHGPEMVAGNNAFDLRTFPLNDRARFFNSVTNGKRAMPPWKGILSEEEIGIVWAYVGTRGGKL